MSTNSTTKPATSLILHNLTSGVVGEGVHHGHDLHPEAPACVWFPQHHLPHVPGDGRGGVLVALGAGQHAHALQQGLVVEEPAHGVRHLQRAVAGVDAETPVHHIRNIALLLHTQQQLQP